LNIPTERSPAEASAASGDASTRTSPEAGALRKTMPKKWLVIAALLVVLAGATYLYLGGRSAMPISVAPTAQQDAASPRLSGPTKPLKALSDEQLERMVGQATSQTQQEPANKSAWAMLAHSYEMLGKFGEAAKAYATLAQLLPNDAQVLADYADVLAVVNGRTFKGEPAALLKRALAIDSKNTKALVLMGSAALEAEDHKQALSYLERARSGAVDPALLQEIDASIAQAKALSGAAGGAAVAPALAASVNTAANGAAPLAARVSGTVWLTDKLRATVPPQATLFLFARPAGGSRMPVALLRRKVSDLPLNFTLDDSMAMDPKVSLSMQSTVVVVARISLRGNVIPQAGDLEGLSAPVPVGSKDLKLEISEVLK
jgi:cytochrome c-type biogenesis protein CcmH